MSTRLLYNVHIIVYAGGRQGATFKVTHLICFPRQNLAMTLPVFVWLKIGRAISTYSLGRKL